MKPNLRKSLARLEACRLVNIAANYDESELAGLPDPVQRYFRTVLQSGQPMVARAEVSHAGAFRTSNSPTGWRPFSSIEVFTTALPGFVWDASIRMFPGMRVRVLDSYIEGSASMTAKCFGIIPILNASGASELAAGALQRYLAEAVWLPTALLPSQGVQWQSIDDLRALATLKDGPTRVSLEFEFNRDGEITAASTPSRYRAVKGSYVPTPWACRYANYADLEKMRIPLEGEVEWRLPDGPLSYWRGRVTSVFYEYTTAESAATAPELPKEHNELYRAQSGVLRP